MLIEMASHAKKKFKPKPLTDSVALDQITAVDVEPEDAYKAAQVMAGIAAGNCNCFPFMHAITNADVHMADCPTCGLRDVLDALAIREMSRAHQVSIKKVL